MLLTQIESDFIESFKQKNTRKKDTLGILKTRFSQWKSEKKNAGKEINDGDIIEIIASEIKKRNQSIEMFSRIDSTASLANIANETLEIKILKDYLPKQMTIDEIHQQIQLVVESKPERLMAAVMQHFSKNFKGQYDNKTLQELLKN